MDHLTKWIPGKRGAPWAHRHLVALIALFFAVASCDTLLDVEAPTQVPEETLAEPGNASLLVSSAVADFDCAFGEYVVSAGLLGDELADAQVAAALWQYDRRSVPPEAFVYQQDCASGLPGIYQTLTTARYSADNAVTRISGFSDDEVAGRDELLAVAQAYSGYSRLLLGEAFCSAGSLQEGEGGLVPGPEVDSEALFSLAEERFTDAIDRAGSIGADSIVNMAYVGRARARLNLGDGPGAVSDAQQVPEGFERPAHFSAQSFRSSNRVWTMNNRDQLVTVEDDFRNLTFEGVADPRVPAIDQDQLASDAASPWWTQDKYGGQSSPIPLASGTEAQLIIAEVELGQDAVDIINQLHVDAGLPTWTPDDAADDIEVLGHVAEERRRELFLQSQHFHDKIRLGRKAEALGVTPSELDASLPATPAAGEPFQKGGSYGPLECLPLPQIEADNNPNI